MSLAFNAELGLRYRFALIHMRVVFKTHWMSSPSKGMGKQREGKSKEALECSNVKMWRKEREMD